MRFFVPSIICIVFFFVFHETSIAQNFPNFCSGSTNDISINITGISERRLTWTFTNNANILGATANNGTPSDVINQRLTNTTNSNQTITFTVRNTPTSGSPQTFTVQVTVLPTPSISNRVANWNPISNGCGAFNFTASTNVALAPNGFNWRRDPIWEFPMLTGNSTFINDNIIDTTSAAVNISYYVTMMAANGCSGQDTLIYKINPTPFIKQPLVYDTICSEQSVKPFVPQTQLTSGVYYSWPAPAAAGLSGMTAGAYNPPNTRLSNFNQAGINNSTANPVNVNFNITPLYQFGTASNAYCAASSTVQYVLTVNPKPLISSPQNVSTCSGTAFRFTPTTGRIPANTVYTWIAPQYSDPSLVSGGSSLTQSPSVEYLDPPISQVLLNRSLVAQTATYNVIAKAGNCVAAPFDLVVNINPTPAVTLLSDTLMVCSGTAPTFSPTSSLPSGQLYSTLYNWGIPQVSISGALTGASSATNQTSFAPVLSNSRTVPVFATYRITPATNSSVTSPLQTCQGSTFTVVVKVDPVVSNANLNPQSITQAICSGETAIIKPSPTPLGTTFTWTNPSLNNGLVINTGSQNQSVTGDTAIVSNLSYSGVNAGGNATFSVIPKSGNCTGSSFNVVITVKPIPNVATVDNTVCSGAPFSTSPGSNLVGVTTSYTWELPEIIPANSLSGASANTSPLQSITQTLSNSINEIAQAMYTVTPTAQGCKGKPFTLVTKVNPNPILPNKDTTICPGFPFSMYPSPLPYITTFTWDAPIYNIPNAVTGGSDQKTPLPFFGQVLTNVTNNVDVTSTYKLTPYFGECPGKPFSVIVTVKASPYITDTLESVVCSGSAFTVKMPQNLPPGTLFRWDDPTYSNGITGGTSVKLLQSSISQILKNTNSDTTSGFAFYSVTPVANGCTGSIFPVKVKVKANSAVLTSPLAMPAICSGSTFNYTPTSNFPGTAFIWERASIIGLENGATSGYADISEVLNDTIGDPITVQYKYSLLYNGCVNPKTQTVSVVVNPQPRLVSPLDPVPICSESVFNYAPVSNTRDVEFSWSRSFVVGIKESLTNGIGSISEKLTNNTFNIIRVPYVYTMKANGCTNTQTIYEVVNPVLTLNDMKQEVCSGRDFSITPPNAVRAEFLWSLPKLDNGLVGGTENKNVPLAAVTGKITNLADTQNIASYTLVPIIPGASSGGCLGNPFKLSVVVNPIPVLSSPTDLSSICSGTTFTYIPTSKTPGTIFSWTRDAVPGISNAAAKGTFMISETLLDTTINPVRIVYRYRTTFNGCTDSSQFVRFTVNPAPIVPDQKVTICSGEAFSLPTELEPLRTTYTWDAPTIVPNNTLIGFSGRTIPQTLVYDSLTNTGNTRATAIYTIRPSNPVCSLSSFNVLVTVKPSSTVGEQVTYACDGRFMSFEPKGVPTNTLYKWKFNELNPPSSLSGYSNNDSLFVSTINQKLRNVSNTILRAGYMIYPNTDGCNGKPFELKINVHPLPSLRIEGSAISCQGSTDSLKLSFTGNGPWSFSYVDNLDKTLNLRSGITTPAYTFLQPKLPSDTVYQFDVMTVSDAFCSNPVDQRATPIYRFTKKLNPLPMDSVFAPKGNLICLNQSQSLLVNALGRSYQWFRNDTIIPGATAGNYEAFNGGLYKARVTDAFGCTNFTVNSIRMTDLKTFEIKFTNDPINCVQTTKQFLNLSDTSAIRNIIWKWNFNGEDSANRFNASLKFTKPGLKKINLSARISSCNSAISRDSIIYIAAPIKAVNLPTVTTNSARPIQLQARSFEGVVYRYDWKPSWGLSSYAVRNPIFNYGKTQQYFIDLISPEGCVTVDTIKVMVFDSALVDILVPKAITPNGDGVNDIAFAYPAGLKALEHFKVFDRYGRLVFETKNPALGWDGTIKGSPLPMEVYHWMAKGIDQTGAIVIREGNILLIR